METRETDRIQVEVHERHDEDLFSLVRGDLLRNPPRISPRFLYDERGSRLFERICEQPEYYQTRTETAILRGIAAELAATTRAEEVVELGSGAAVKTRTLLDALERAGTLHRYVPFDVSEEIVHRTAAELVALYPDLQVHAVVGDFLTHLDRIPRGSRQLCIFLGGTIGNFEPEEAARFLAELGSRMDRGSCLLLGTDLVKDHERLEAAYNDAAGVTAQFNRNVLRVLNRLLGGDFDPDAFDHLAFYNEQEHRIEMWLTATRAQRVRLPAIDLTLDFAPGERIHTEISRKFDRESVGRLLAASGFEPAQWFTDSEKLFALSLARKV